MANADTEVTLEQLHDAIVDAIKLQFPDLQTVEFYSDQRTDAIPKPACLLELSEMDAAPDLDPGTEQIALDCRFEARFVIGFRTVKAKLEVRKLAGAFAAWLRKENHRWGLPVAPAQVIGCYQDDFSPDLDQYECWRVEWRQVIHLGESVWNDEPGAEVPTTVYVGFEPDVGPAHIDDYVQLTPEE